MLTYSGLFLLLPLLASPAVPPVNRPFTVYAGQPTPDLSCLVGFISLDIEKTFKTSCKEARNITIDISIQDRKNLKWPVSRRKMRFASQPDGSAWKDPVEGWLCSTTPMEGTVTYDCVPQEVAPAWFKKPIPGPALGPHMRQPGCNGAVCYCNDGDFCNSAVLTHLHLLLPLLASLRHL